MIEGAVSPQRRGLIRLLIRGPAGRSEEIEAVVDTDFTGFLVLPVEVISRLSLPFLGKGIGRMADGNQTVMDIYRAEVEWDGRAQSVYALAGNGPCLVGVSLMYGYVLTFEAIDGGRVIIQKLP